MKGGWYFDRLSDGRVRITLEQHDPDQIRSLTNLTPHRTTAIFTREGWEEIITGLEGTG